MNYLGGGLKKDSRDMTLEVKLPPYLVVLRGTASTARPPQVPLQRVHPGIRPAAAADELKILVQTNRMSGAQAGCRGERRRDAAADVSGQFGVLVRPHMAQEVSLAPGRLREAADWTFEHAFFTSSACGDGGSSSSSSDRMRLATANAFGWCSRSYGPNLPGFSSWSGSQGGEDGRVGLN